MGTKGRDLLFWQALIAVITAAILLVAGVVPRMASWSYLVILLLVFKFYFIDMPAAIKYSRRAGLEAVVLLPLNKYWAKILLLIGGIKLGNWKTAYEIHIVITSENPIEIRNAVERDILKIARGMNGLFIWETKMAVPKEVRKLIKLKEQQNDGFWRKGGWFPPPLPFLSPSLIKGKKVIRRGAVVNKIIC